MTWRSQKISQEIRVDFVGKTRHETGPTEDTQYMQIKILMSNDVVLFLYTLNEHGCIVLDD